MKKITTLLVACLGMVMMAFAPAMLATDSGVAGAAIDPKASLCQGTGGSGSTNCTGQTTTNTTLPQLIQRIVNIMLFIIGAISVIMIIIGGIKYTTSGGDANQARSAKDTILYSIVGIVVAVMAYAIVNFVLKNL